jgi:hypothetical protein
MGLSHILLWSGIALGAAGGALQLRDIRGELLRLYEPPGVAFWKPGFQVLIGELHAAPDANAFGCYTADPEVLRKSR